MHVPSAGFLAIPVAAYLLGSIPFGLLLAKLFQAGDVRQAGSGNIGATNVARVAGPVAGVLTLLLDACKGTLAVWLAARFTQDSSTWMMAAGFAALLGHCFSVWLGFRGGKGVATAAGIFLYLSPLSLLGAVIVFILVVMLWRYVSLASLSAAAVVPLLIYFLWAPQHAPPTAVTFGSLAAALLIFYKHDGNIQRLIQGKEPKFSLSRKRGVP